MFAQLTTLSGPSSDGYTLGAAFWEDRRARLASGASARLDRGDREGADDLAGQGDASWRYFTWDVIGTATGLLISCFVDKYLFGRERAAAVQPRAFRLNQPIGIANDLLVREPFGLMLHRCPPGLRAAAFKE